LRSFAPRWRRCGSRWPVASTPTRRRLPGGRASGGRRNGNGSRLARCSASGSTTGHTPTLGCSRAAPTWRSTTLVDQTMPSTWSRSSAARCCLSSRSLPAAYRSGRWRRVGWVPPLAAAVAIPEFFRQDIFDPQQCQVVDHLGRERAASPEECVGLERDCSQADPQHTPTTLDRSETASADAAGGVVPRLLAACDAQGRDLCAAPAARWRSACIRRRGRCSAGCGQYRCGRGRDRLAGTVEVDETPASGPAMAHRRDVAAATTPVNRVP
jgi:hypothetical protein